MSHMFDFVAKKNAISSQQEIEKDEKILGFVVPEIYFGNNQFTVKSEKIQLRFNALNALKTVEKKVNYKVHNEWVESKYKPVKPYDWTYLTAYKGDIVGNYVSTFDNKPSNTFLPIRKLSRSDDILYFDKIDLFTDEFSDNGLSHFDIKCRSMEYGFFILLRQFIRIDHVIYILRDCRIYHEYGSNIILREYIHKELPYSQVNKVLDCINDLVDYPSNIVTEIVDGNFVIQERIEII
eukprot:NODE_39_length_29903_cov_0.529057.p12 type:complete len:237 gc:universal NODE_39_length_29903_cov_0.529057:8464-7754(-)